MADDLAAAANQVVDTCIADLGSNITDLNLVRCVTNAYSSNLSDEFWLFSRNILLVYSTALVFYMQAGFAMLCAGAVRKKNVSNTMIKNLLDACGAALAFFTVGYAFAFGDRDYDSPDKTFIGTSNFFLIDVDDLAYWLFQYAFSAAAATIVAGTLAERCQMSAYMAYSILLGGFVYPVIVHAIWSPQGFLSTTAINPLWGVGMIDFAGGGVVHMTGGTTALFATSILGPRRGRFHDSTGRKLNTPNEMPGHSVALQMLGTFSLWFGWYGFNAGSALIIPTSNAETVLPLSGVNTTLAGGTAGIVALFANLIILERTTGESFFDLKYLMNGSLSGLVSITASCGIVEPWVAVIIGACAGLFYILGSWALIKLRLDDCVEAIPVHMVNGIWGVIAVGLFASPDRLEDAYGHSKHVGWFYSFGHNGSDGTLLACQCVGILFIFGWILFTMFPFFIWLDMKGWFRSDPLDEIVGLDTSYHGGMILGKGNDSEGIDPQALSEMMERKQNKKSNRNTDRSRTLESEQSRDRNEEDESDVFDT